MGDQGRHCRSWRHKAGVTALFRIFQRIDGAELPQVMIGTLVGKYPDFLPRHPAMPYHLIHIHFAP